MPSAAVLMLMLWLDQAEKWEMEQRNALSCTTPLLGGRGACALMFLVLGCCVIARGFGWGFFCFVISIHFAIENEFC